MSEIPSRMRAFQLDPRCLNSALRSNLHNYPLFRYDFKSNLNAAASQRVLRIPATSVSVLLLGTVLLQSAASKSICLTKRSAHSEDASEGHVSAPDWVKLIKTPGDGSCLFHALSASRSGKIGSAQNIRMRVVDAIPKFASDREFNGATLQQWIEWETGLSPAVYAGLMSKNSAWGGQVSGFETTH